MAGARAHGIFALLLRVRARGPVYKCSLFGGVGPLTIFRGRAHVRLAMLFTGNIAGVRRGGRPAARAIGFL